MIHIKLFEQYNESHGSKKLSKDHIGIVLRHKFPADEIFLDLNWIDINHPEISVDFPSEYEVIVTPKRRNVEVHKIIRPEE